MTHQMDSEVLRPNRRVFVEIRAARGVAAAAEAADFATEVLRELTRVGEQRGWRVNANALEEAAGVGVHRVEVEILGGGSGERAS